MKTVAARAFLLLLLLTTAVSGCSSVRIGVDPWDRDLLALPAMALDAHPAGDGIDDHIYFSKEATAGGRGFGGGGCGCN